MERKQCKLVFICLWHNVSRSFHSVIIRASTTRRHRNDKMHRQRSRRARCVVNTAYDIVSGLVFVTSRSPLSLRPSVDWPWNDVWMRCLFWCLHVSIGPLFGCRSKRKLLFGCEPRKNWMRVMCCSFSFFLFLRVHFGWLHWLDRKHLRLLGNGFCSLDVCVCVRSLQLPTCVISVYSSFGRW